MAPKPSTQDRPLDYSEDEAEQFAAAYHVRKGALVPLRRMLATPADRFAQQYEDRAANDAAVVAVVEDLAPLAKQTRGWMRWAQKQVAGCERVAIDGDDASLEAALIKVRALRAPASELVEQAVAVLDVAQRAVLGRHLISDLGHADDVWLPHAQEELPRMASHNARRARYSRLDEMVERQLEHLLSTYPGLVRYPFQRFLRSRKRPMFARWGDLYLCMVATTSAGREIDTAHERLERAAADRRRALHQAKLAQRKHEEQTETDRRAAAAEAVQDQAAELAGRIREHHADWALPGQQMRKQGWASLDKQLIDGICDDDGRSLVGGLNKPEAGTVLAVLALASGNDGDTTAARLSALLATEADLLRERARLHELMHEIPIDAEVRSTLAAVGPDLDNACAWLRKNLHHLFPVLAAHEPAAAASLREALDRDTP